MTPRPFYRSRLFWFGLFTFSFLFWAWKDSGNYVTWVSQSGISFNLRGSSVSMGFTYAAKAQGLRWARRKSTERPPDSPVQYSSDKDRFFLRLSFPVVIGLYLGLWFAAQAWWQRRKSRLMKLHAAP